MWGDCKDTREQYYLNAHGVIFIGKIQFAAACGHKFISFPYMSKGKAAKIKLFLEGHGYTVGQEAHAWTTSLIVSGWHKEPDALVLTEEEQALVELYSEDIPF